MVTTKIRTQATRKGTKFNLKITLCDSLNNLMTVSDVIRLNDTLQK